METPGSSRRQQQVPGDPADDRNDAERTWSPTQDESGIVDLAIEEERDPEAEEATDPSKD